jgi:amino acid transporter
MTTPSVSGSGKASGRINLLSAAALGVGGMMGAGLYTLLGLAARSTGVWLPVAFLLAGIAASFSVYSYARLGATYPSRGGAAQFMIEEFGDTVTSQGLNIFQYLSYLIATSLYAAGFAEYVGALAGDSFPPWAGKTVGVGVVVLFTLVNFMGSKLVGKSQTVIIGTELVILGGLILLGLSKADPSRLTASPMPGFLGVITGAALLYVTYQGFGVVANAAGEMDRPQRDLPRAMAIALGVVAMIYLLVSLLVVLVLPLAQIQADAGHVLADVGQAVAGRAGFVVIALAAILATSSAVNATLFAASNVGYDLGENRQLPRSLTRLIWREAPLSLPVSAAVVMVLVAFFPLDAVGQMTSLAFLVVYGAISAGHLRVRHRTGARAWPLVAAVVLNAVLFLTLLVDAIHTGPASTWITLLAALVGSFVVAALRSRRRFH